MDKNINGRIQRIISTLCKNNSDFCRRIGRKETAVKDIVGGRKTYPGYELISDILASDLGINPSWLIMGEGNMLKGNEDKKPQPSSKMLPLIPIEAFAGPGVPTYEDERIEDYYTVTDFKNSDFLIRVKGDSMSPKFCGGDLVACKRIAADKTYFIQWGRIYVIYTLSQGVMIKRIQQSERDGWITCVSDNPKYAPFDVPKEDIVSIALVNGAITLE